MSPFGDVLLFFYLLFEQIMDIPLFYGLTFGTLLIGVAFFSILISVLKSIFAHIGFAAGGAVRRGDKDD